MFGQSVAMGFPPGLQYLNGMDLSSVLVRMISSNTQKKKRWGEKWVRELTKKPVTQAESSREADDLVVTAWRMYAITLPIQDFQCGL